ncbi:hypothetical protein ACQPYA_05540 [Micromonospora sp. CA-263727]|uniref:hypothetical protein n=1 Tax=Micromonospora sp. CA-263727 TaxID=3239967 RepID=UPI003D923E60
MTSPAEPPPNDPTPASQVTRPLRELAATVLLGANAVFLFVGLIRLLAPQGPYSTVTGRAGSSFFAFIGVEAIVLPVLAVLLATHVAPVVPRAKPITQVALVQYAASAVLGGLTLLVWMVGRLAEAQVFDAMTGVLTRTAWVALFGVAVYVVWTVWQRLYHVPRPKPEPGVYGTPQPGWPPPGGPGQSGGHPGTGQAGHPSGGWPTVGQPSGWPGGDQPTGHATNFPVPGQPGGYPGSGQAGGFPVPGQGGGYPGSGQAGGFPVPGQGGAAAEEGQSAGWPVAGQAPTPAAGPSSAPHTWPPHGQPAVPPQPAAPPSPPFGQPASADPTQTIPRQSADPTQTISPEHADPTQAIPRPDGDADRTQRIDPGENPA